MAAKANIYVDQGTTFTTYLNVSGTNEAPIDLTGYTFLGQIRKWYTSSSAVNFNINTVNGPSNGVIEISLDANTTTTLDYGRYVYDVKMTDTGGNVTRIVEGILTVNPEVAK